MLNTPQITCRVILEVAGTIATNGIQELSHEGDMSQFGYVRSCLMATAYNSMRSMPNFSMAYGPFCEAILAQVERELGNSPAEDAPAGEGSSHWRNDPNSPNVY